MDVKFRNIAIGVSLVLFGSAALLFVLRSDSNQTVVEQFSVRHHQRGPQVKLSDDEIERITDGISEIPEDEIRDALATGAEDAIGKLNESVQKLDIGAIKEQFIDAVRSGKIHVKRTVERN